MQRELKVLDLGLHVYSLEWPCMIRLDDASDLGDPTGFIDFDGEPMPYWLPAGADAVAEGVGGSRDSEVMP